MPHTLAVVTGASRGLGLAIAENFVASLDPENALHLVLIGRTGDALEALAARVASGARMAVSAEVIVGDLSETDFSAGSGALFARISGRFSDLASAHEWSRVVIVHNAASIGSLAHIGDYGASEFAQLGTQFALNVTSVMTLTSVALRTFAHALAADALVFVNVSSLLAVKAFPCWGLYASHKAARDMFFSVLATEHPGRTLCLSYAPGPLDTDMQLLVRQEMADSEQRALYTSMHESGTLVACPVSAAKLTALLMQRSFASGQHIDFYDC